MAWTVASPLVGKYMGGTPGGAPSNGAVALYELCRGIHERQELLGKPKHTFYTRDMELTSDISLSMFRDVYFGNNDAESPFWANLRRARGAIDNIVTTYSIDYTTTDVMYWWERSGGLYSGKSLVAGHRWYVDPLDATAGSYAQMSDLSAAVGYDMHTFDFPGRLGKQSVEPLQKLRDALDLLLYPAVWWAPIGNTQPQYSSVEGVDDLESTPSEGWAARYRYATDAESANVFFGVTQYQFSQPVPYFPYILYYYRFGGVIRPSSSFYYKTDQVGLTQGEVVHGALQLAQNVNSTPFSVNISGVGNFNVPIPGSSAVFNDSYRYVDMASTDVVIGAQFNSSISISNLPPMSDTIYYESVPRGYGGFIGAGTLYAQFDVSSQLSNSPEA